MGQAFTKVSASARTHSNRILLIQLENDLGTCTFHFSRRSGLIRKGSTEL